MTRMLNWVVLGAVAVAMVSCGRSEQGSGTEITIRGSDTMVHLAMDWAEAYMDVHPDANISVSGGGSGTGIKAFINGTIDVACSSRDMTAEEKEGAAKAGREPKEVAVAMDGIAIAVNPQNPVNEITMEQLKKIYTGAYARWSELGGPDEPIVALSRESSSGTYVFFQEHVLAKQDYAASVRLMPATAGIIQALSQDRWAIGYVGLGYAEGAGDKVKVLKVKANDGAAAVAPSEQTVKSGEYSIARKLYLYVPAPTSAPVQGFVDFVLSDAGQEIVRNEDYISIR